MRYTANKRGFMLCNNRVSLDIMIYCNLRLLYWLYPLYGFIGTYFLRYIHELISFIHFMMNSFLSFMCYGFIGCCYPWICIAMIDIIPYGINPYVIPTILVVIIHRLFFFVTRFTRCYRVDLWLCCGVAHFMILLYRGEQRRMLYLYFTKWATLKIANLLALSQPTTNQLETSIHWNN